MLVRDWVDGALVGLLKDQHKHTLVYKLMLAFDRVWQSHNWSFAQDVFNFQTRAPFESDEAWTGSVGDDYIVVLGTTGDIGYEWTGAEIEISDDDDIVHMRVRQIGNPLVGYDTTVIYLDQVLPVSFASASVRVFRREYVPRNSLPHFWPAESFSGRLRLRDRYLDDRLFEGITEPEEALMHGWEDSTDTRLYRVRRTRRIPAPLFAPVFDSTTTYGTKVGVAGKYFFACVYVDRHANIISAPGPILEYDSADTSAGAAVIMEYGATDGVPEQSYDLWLLCSRVDPVGFDGSAVGSRKTDAMIPFWKVAVHPKASGGFPKVPLSEDIPLGIRVWPSGECVSLYFREVPQTDEIYSIDGKMQLPWMADLADDPPIPRDFADVVNHGLRASIAGQDGLLSDQRFNYGLRDLRKKDVAKGLHGTIAVRNMRSSLSFVGTVDVDE